MGTNGGCMSGDFIKAASGRDLAMVLVHMAVLASMALAPRMPRRLIMIASPMIASPMCECVSMAASAFSSEGHPAACAGTAPAVATVNDGAEVNICQPEILFGVDGHEGRIGCSTCVSQ